MLTSRTRRSGLKSAFRLPSEWPSSPVIGRRSYVSLSAASNVSAKSPHLLLRCVMDYAEEIWGVEQVKVPEVTFTDKKTSEPASVKK